ncbi:MAG: hypothetical protein A2Y33_00410 [Spirochaetes bacterium GWF1_51_8]|nr:MAG: hypothetical protein A2Y33_00410 [Spirochaetes bacterium GWF1_51_8]
MKPPDKVIVPDTIKPDKGGEPKLELILLRNLAGHDQYVFYVQFSPDGKKLVSGSADKTIRIWDIDAGIEETRVWGIYNAVWGIPVAYSPSGKYIVGGVYENLIVYDAADKMKELSKQTAHEKGIQSLKISPDGKYVITGGVDGTINVWTLPDLTPVNKVQGHEKEIWSLCLTPDGKYLLTGGEDTLGKIWSFPDLTLKEEIKYHCFPIEYVDISKDGKMFLMGSADSSTSVWKWGQYSEPFRVLKGHMGNVLVAVFSKEGKYIFSGGEDDEIIAFNIESGQEVARLKDHWGDVMSLCVSPNGKYLASGSRDKTIKVYLVQE